MATKTLRVFAEYTSTGFVPMPTAGNIDYGFTLGSTFPATTPATYQTDNPDLVVTVSAMTDFYVWIRINGQAWNPSYTRNVRVYPDSPNINNVVVNMIIATGPAGVSSYTQIVQTSNRLYFNGATTDATYNSKFAGKTYINELNFGTAPGLATVATSGAYADLTGKPTLATVATSGLFTDLSSKPSGTAPLSYNSGTNSFVITQANTSTNGFLSSTDWNTFNNKFATPAGTTLQYVDGTGALQTFPVLASADKLVINVRNSSGVSMPKGSVVYINGATGNKPTVALAQANSDATSAQTLGLLQTTLANNAEGNVVIVGSIIDLNTSAFTEGQQLYLSPTTAGAYTTTKPYAPNHLVYVGVVTRSHVSLGVIEVKVQNGYEMDELHDVSAQSPSNNDGLFYNTTTSLWEKKSIATVLGYTPYNGTDTSIKALFSASAPLSYSDGAFSISQATTSSNGYLSSTDWNTFNGKESVLSFTTPLVRTTNTISINQASASTSGYLSSTDWNTFNNKSTTSGTVTSVAMTMPLGLSVSGSPITTSGTFGITLTAGYVIPSTTSTSEWGIAYNNRITSLTVTGSSGSATLVSNVLNIPTYTLVGLGGQAALNGTGFVKATGTTISYDNTSYLPLSGGLMTSSIQFSDTTNLKRGIYGSMGTDDNWFVGANAGGVSQGYLEIATGDDGTEPIYATQYTGNAFTTGTVARRVKILDESGNSIFPNTLTATTLVKSGGTSSQFLKADGSIDTSVYLTTASASSTYLTIATASSTYQTIITNPVTGTGTTNTIAYWTSASAIGALALTTYPSLTELSYVKGVTSAIQTQINTKQATVTLTTTGTSGAATFSSNTLNIPNYGSALSGYLPLTGGTLTGALGGTSATFTGDVTINKSSPTLQLNAPTGTTGQFNINNGVGSLMWAMYSSTGGSNTQGNWALYSAGKTGGAGAVIEITPAGASTFSGNITVDKSSPNINLNGASGTSAQYNINNSSGTLHWAMYSTIGGSGVQANWQLYSAGKTGGAGNVIDITPTGAATFSSSVTANSGVLSQVIGSDGTYGATYPMYAFTGTTNGSHRIFAGTSDDMYFAAATSRGFEFRANGGTSPHLKILSTGAATFSSSVTANNFIVSGGNNVFLLNAGNATTGWQQIAMNNTSGSTLLGVEGSTAGTLATGSLAYASVLRNYTNTALQFGTNNIVRATITSAGNVGIGTTSPAGKLNVSGSSGSYTSLLYGTDCVINVAGANTDAALIFASGTTYKSYIYANAAGTMECIATTNIAFGAGGSEKMRITSGGNILMGTTTDNGERLYVSGAIRATGNITANSDLTLKKNLEIITNPIDKLMQLNGYSYQWKENDEYQYGVVAQEVEKVLPYAVQTGSNKIKGVAYNQLTPLLIEGFKSHESEITILKARVKYLESKLA